MKQIITILAVLLGLLSLAAGGAKMSLVPEEVVFLNSYGFTDAAIIVFGVAQVLGGVLILVPRTRLFGSLICSGGFGLSAGLLLAEGNLAFGAVSLLPVVFSGLIAYRSFATVPDTAP
jgi:hypothetical protein